MNRLLGTKEAEKLEEEELEKSLEMSEKSNRETSGKSKGDSKINKLTGMDRRKSFKKNKTLSLVDIIQKESAEDPNTSQSMNRSDLLHKLAISRTNTMKKREQTTPLKKLSSGNTIASIMHGNKQKKI